MTDDKGNFIAIRMLSASKRKKMPMLTIVEIFDSVSNKKEVFELTGDIRINKNGRKKVYKLADGHFEVSRMDADGAIYHMLALNDGVVVRKITINKKSQIRSINNENTRRLGYFFPPFCRVDALLCPEPKFIQRIKLAKP